MKVQFPNKSPQDILSLFQEKLEGRKLGKLLDFSLKDHCLTISVSKFGTSRFLFHLETNPHHTLLFLQEKTVPLTHKALEKELATKLSRIIEDCGGEILVPYM